MSKLVFHLFHFLEAQGKQYSEPLLCQPERIFTFFHHSYGDSLKNCACFGFLIVHDCISF